MNPWHVFYMYKYFKLTRSALYDLWHVTWCEVELLIKHEAKLSALIMQQLFFCEVAYTVVIPK